jgi:hypothetical protein
VATLLAVAATVTPAMAQSLGEIAERERIRREKEAAKRPAAKVITEDELRGRRTSGTVSQPAADAAVVATAAPAAAAAPAAGAAPAGAPPEKTEEELRAEKQAEWRQKLQEAQANVSTLRARQDQIQAELNDTRTVYGPNRASLLNHLEKTKSALAQAEQTVTNLEEEGRRSRYR